VRWCNLQGGDLLLYTFVDSPGEVNSALILNVEDHITYQDKTYIAFYFIRPGPTYSDQAFPRDEKFTDQWSVRNRRLGSFGAVRRSTTYCWVVVRPNGCRDVQAEQDPC